MNVHTEFQDENLTIFSAVPNSLQNNNENSLSSEDCIHVC